MEGIPQDALEQHRNRIIQNYYQDQEDRRIATGNPASGQAMPRKKLKMESSDELLKRLAEFRAHKKAGTLPPPTEEEPARVEVCFALTTLLISFLTYLGTTASYSATCVCRPTSICVFCRFPTRATSEQRPRRDWPASTTAPCRILATRRSWCTGR